LLTIDSFVRDTVGFWNTTQSELNSSLNNIVDRVAATVEWTRVSHRRNSNPVISFIFYIFQK